jgi:hypothetical protein
MQLPNQMCKLNNLGPIKFMELLRFLRFHVEMEFGIYNYVPLHCMFNACSMFCIAKNHWAFLCYKDNYKANWCPYPKLSKVVVSFLGAFVKLHKYAFNRPVVWKIWPIQVKTNFMQNEIKSFEVVRFLLNKWQPIFLQNLFGEESSILINRLVDEMSLPTTPNGKVVH